MNTKTVFNLGVGLASVLILGAGCTPEADAPEADAEPAAEATPGAEDPPGEVEYSLTWHVHTGPDSSVGQAGQAWAERVNELTDGRVEIEFFFFEALCSIAESLECAGDGRVDISTTAVSFFPGDFPLGDVVSVPFVTTSSQAQLLASSEMYRNHEEYAAEHRDRNTHVLYWTSTSPAAMGTDEPVGYDWLAGKQIRGVARMVDALEIAGADPVAIPVSEVYESMERGLFDAWFAIPLEAAVIDFSLHEVTPVFTEPGVGVYIGGHTAINLELWESLPADIQEAMNEASREVETDFYEAYQLPAYEQACQMVADAGGEVHVWGEDEIGPWTDAIGDTIFEQWLADAHDRGAEDPDSFFDEYVEVLRQIEQDDDYQSPAEVCLDMTG